LYPSRRSGPGRPLSARKRRQQARGGPAWPDAVNALRQALEWQAEVEAGDINKAGIAKREGVTRARVTQIMKLLNLDEEVQEALLDGEVVWSINQALREAGARAR
jgi:hypothetical protein